MFNQVKNDKNSEKKDDKTPIKGKSQVIQPRSAIPKWGGCVKTGSREIKLLNTCPVDNWLMLLAAANLKHRDAYQATMNIAGKEEVTKVMRMVCLCQYLEAKLELAKFNGIEPISNVINMYGNEQELFVSHMSFAFEHSIKTSCSSVECPEVEFQKLFKTIPHLPGSQHYLQMMLQFLSMKGYLEAPHHVVAERCKMKISHLNWPFHLSSLTQKLEKSKFLSPFYLTDWTCLSDLSKKKQTRS